MGVTPEAGVEELPLGWAVCVGAAGVDGVAFEAVIVLAAGTLVEGVGSPLNVTTAAKVTGHEPLLELAADPLFCLVELVSCTSLTPSISRK